MSKCLFTTLKESVNNPEMLKLGELRFHLNGTSVIIGGKSPMNVKILTDGVTFTNGAYAGTTEQQTPQNSSRTMTTSAACDLSVMQKYPMTQLIGGQAASANRISMDIGMLSFTSELDKIIITDDSTHGDIAVLKNSAKVSYIDISGLAVYGDIADLPVSNNLIWLQFGSISVPERTPQIEGDISALEKFPNIKVVHIPYNDLLVGDIDVFDGNFSQLLDVVLEQSSQITGDVAAFANHPVLRTLGLFKTNVYGHLGDIFDGSPSLKSLTLNDRVEYTAADAAVADAVLSGNGATLRPSGHYFSGGVLVESYT